MKTEDLEKLQVGDRLWTMLFDTDAMKDLAEEEREVPDLVLTELIFLSKSQDGGYVNAALKLNGFTELFDTDEVFLDSIECLDDSIEKLTKQVERRDKKKKDYYDVKNKIRRGEIVNKKEKEKEDGPQEEPEKGKKS